MQIIYGLKKIRKFKRPVVAMGVFDGLHLGHRRVLRAAVNLARHIRGTALVVTFWPHPQKEESLYSLEHRLKLIAEQDIDVCLVIKFNREFAQISSEDFIAGILVRKIGAQHIYVGKNFRFGRGALGDADLLNKLSREYNFQLKLFDVIKIDHQPISSTYIRRLIKRGRLKKAEKLLTRPVTVLGTVIKGISFGRRLGFPTANLNPHHEVLPPSGVYAVQIIFKRKIFHGVCSIRVKPEFNLKKNRQVEVHIFNFKKNIYRKNLEVQFIKKIRDQKKFNSSSALARQIRRDIIQAKSILSYH